MAPWLTTPRISVAVMDRRRRHQRRLRRERARPAPVSDMRLPVTECEFPEVTVICDKNPLLCSRDPQDLIVWQPRRVVGTDPGDVMVQPGEYRHQSSIGALIEKKLHAAVDAERETRSPRSTAAWA